MSKLYYFHIKYHKYLKILNKKVIKYLIKKLSISKHFLQKQTLNKKKKFSKKSQSLQLIFCSFLNWRNSIDPKFSLNLKDEFFSLPFLIFGDRVKLLKNQQRDSQSKKSEMFLFWQYLKENMQKNGEISEKKNFFSYWFLPFLGLVSLQYIQFSFLKTKYWSIFSKNIYFPIDLDSKIDKSESFLDFSSENKKFLKNKKNMILELEQKQLENLIKKFLKEISSKNEFSCISSPTLKKKIFNKKDDTLSSQSLSYLNKNFYQSSLFFWNWYVLDSSRNFNYYKTSLNFQNSSLLKKLNKFQNFLSKEKSYQIPKIFLNLTNSTLPQKYLVQNLDSNIDSTYFISNFHLAEKKKFFSFSHSENEKFPLKLLPLPFFLFEEKNIPTIYKSKIFKDDKKYQEKLKLPVEKVERFFNFFSSLTEKNQLHVLSNISQKKKQKNSLFSYEKACFFWEMYLKNLSFESQKKFADSIEMLRNSWNTDILINHNILFNEIDSLNIWKKINKHSTNNKQKTSFFLKNVAHLKNSNFYLSKEKTNSNNLGDFFLKKNRKKRNFFYKNFLESQKNVSFFVTLQNIKGNLVKTFCFRLLNINNNRSFFTKEPIFSYYLFSEKKNSIGHGISLLKSLNTLKKTIKRNLLDLKSIETKKKLNILNFGKVQKNNKLFLKELSVLQKYPFVISFDQKKKVRREKFFNKRKTQTFKVLKYRFPILMSGYPEKASDFFDKNKQIFSQNSNFLSELNVSNKKEKNKINLNNIRSLLNFQIEIQKRQGLNTFQTQKKDKLKNELKERKKQNFLKNKKFVFFDHTFFFSKKNKSLKELEKTKRKKNIGLKLDKKNLKFQMKKIQKTENFLVSYKSSIFVKSNFFISKFSFLLKKKKSNAKQIVPVNLEMFLSFFSKEKKEGFISFTKYLSNFLNASNYLGDSQIKLGLLKKEKTYFRKNENSLTLDVFRKKNDNYFHFFEKLKNLRKSFTIFRKNFSKKIFLIFKKIQIFFYQKIVKNIFSKSLNQKNREQVFSHMYLSRKSINKKNSIFFKEKTQIQLKLKKRVIKKRSIENFKKKLVLNNLEKRKYEKIFRSYLSYKKDRVLYKEKNKFLFSFLKKTKSDSIKNRLLLKEVNFRFLQNFQRFWKNSSSKYNTSKVIKPPKSFFSCIFSLSKNCSEKKKLKAKKRKKLTLRLSPNEFLKKKHFVFFNEKNVEVIEQGFFKRIEKIQNLQKKRRLKKQKKETRRRKKRKRFYPRPLWLRFRTYKKFLKTRHSLRKRFLPIQRKISNFLKRKSDNIQPIIADVYAFKLGKLEKKNIKVLEKTNKKNEKLEKDVFEKNRNFFSEMKITQATLRKKIYRKNKQKWGHCIYETPLTEKILLKKSPFFWSFPLFNSRNFYQLSNTLKNDFQRMSWKSYWLRQNFTPYLQRVKSTLENLQEYSIKECFFQTFKCFLLNFLGFDVFEEKFSNSYLNQNQIFLTLKKSPLSISKIHLKNSIDTQSKVLSRNPSEYSQAVLFSEYQRIFYNRMLDSFKNIKKNLSGNGLFQARFSRAGRRKISSNEKQIKNFWQKLSYFLNLEVPTSAIQASGYGTKLRVRWALNKTNLLTFKERNTVQSLWSSVKLRDQKKSKKRSMFKKSFQSLKKILSNLNSQDLESLCFLKIQNKQKKTEILGSFLSNPEIFQLKMELKSSFFFSKKKKRKQKKDNRKFFYQPRFFRKRFLNYWWNTELLNNINTGNCFLLFDFQYPESFFFFVSLWIFTLFLHVSIFCSLFLIPEIRSLLKFQILVVSKICLSLTIAIFYFYNGLKNWNLRLNFFTSNFSRQGFFQSSLLLQKQNIQPEKKIFKIFKWKSKSALEKSIFYLKDKDLKKKVLIFQTKSKKMTSSFLKISKKRKGFKYFEKSSLLFNIYRMTFPRNVLAFRIQFQFFFKTLFKSCLFIFLKIQELKLFSSKKKENLKIQLIQFFSFLNSKSPLTIFSIWSFVFIKNTFQFFSKCFTLFSKIFLKILDFFENVLIIIYKFLEKPAEFLIEWMAQVFLIEWSSDRLAYVPETLDTEIWNSVYKTSRSLRGFSFPATFLSRRIWSLMEVFFKLINKPDKDLISRQKKGIFFWDLWADILLQIAEKYNLNIPSLNTLKEEQEFFMEKLLQDQDWNKYSTKLEQMTPFSLFVSIDSVPKKAKLQKQLGRIWLDTVDFLTIQKNRKKQYLKTKEKESNKYLFKYSNIFLKGEYENRKFSFKNKPIRRWSFHQDWIFQGRETDLFLDVHPPKSFLEISHLKFSELSHQPIATFVCQISSGIFSKQVAKNILLIGPPGLGKSLFVQAMAGETELQMISEHAHRYSLVSRGVAVGMKLLKHVFDSISFSTPCFFLIEDIHLIGEKRPILISDDENAKAMDMSVGYEQEEVHEKNQVIYQLSRHSLCHYRKPYKGDFSLLIPTNHFCFDLFLGVSPPRTRHFLRGPSHPLPIDSIQSQLDQQTEKMKSSSNFEKFRIDSIPEKLVTRLQLPSKKFFSPPPTSPFTLFTLKEQQKFQPKQVVEQIPWSGLSWDQILRMPKTTYSVKTKVAMLADIARTHFTVKLEMITDLLVLIDNVRSLRGFVVFGTTHMPHVLDPALRRPGRFDETISFPSLPNLLTRWQILKTSVSHFSKTLDCLDSAVMCKNLYESQLSDLLLRAKFSLLNQSFPFVMEKEEKMKKKQEKYRISNFFPNNENEKLDLMKFRNFDNSSSHLSFSKFLTDSISEKITTKISSPNSQFDNFYLKNRKLSDLNSALKIFLQNSPQNFLRNKGSLKNSLLSVRKKPNSYAFQSTQSKSLLTILRRLTFSSFIPSGPSNVLAMTYFHVSKLLIQTNFLMDATSFGFLLFSPRVSELSENSVIQTSKLLFSSSNDLGSEFLRLFAGKIGEFFVFSSVKKNIQLSNFQNFFRFDSLTNTKIFSNSLYSFYGIDEIWRSATNLAFSILQKRYFYSKNLLVSRLLCFENFSSFKEVPSPPSSFCYIPGKRYENFKRVEKDFHQKSSFSLSEKIHLIQEQRLNKKLYKKAVQELFLFPRNVQDFSVQKTKMSFNKRFFTSFHGSTRELVPINSSTVRVTSSNCYYRKRILARHRFSFVNHWWNGHLPEHNVETTFLSDVDWRYSFKESLGDIVIDFPDTEQYYNPRSRRWMLNSGYWADWNSFEKVFNEEISYHFLSESFHKAFNFLENNREILDHFAYKLLKNGFLKEIDLITIFSRFFIKNFCKAKK